MIDEDIGESCHIRLPAEYCDPLIGGPPPMYGDVPGVIFRPARHYRSGRKRWPNLRFRVFGIVIHTAECEETKNAAEGLQNYAATMPDGRSASWHYAVDCDSVTQSVHEADVAHHAPPVNDCTIGIETAGRAGQLAAGWDDAFSAALLANQLAPLVAGICLRHGLPILTRTDDELRQGLGAANALAARPGENIDDWVDLQRQFGGIFTHGQISRTFKKSTHWDPGKSFPMDRFLAMVRERSVADTGEVIDDVDQDAKADPAPPPSGHPV